MQHLDDETYSILKAVTIPNTGDYKSNPELFCELYKTAIYGDTSITLKNEVLECKQKSDETVSDFVYRLRSKASIAYTNIETANETCLSAILRGLKDPQMKRKLNEDTTIKTFEDAIKLAKRLEQINKMLDNDTVQIEPILKETAVTFKPSRNRSPSPWPNQDDEEEEETRSRPKYKNDYRRNNFNNRRHDYRSSSRDRPNKPRYSDRSQSPAYRYNRERSNSRSPYRGNRYDRNRSPSYSRQYNRNRYSRNASPANTRRNIICWNCNKPGHVRNNCFSYRRNNQAIHHVQDCTLRDTAGTQSNYDYSCCPCTNNSAVNNETPLN